MTAADSAHERERQRREALETGFTDYEYFVGKVLCPAREKCPAGFRGIFTPLADGRLPMHRDMFGHACSGARQKPTTPPLQLRALTP